MAAFLYGILFGILILPCNAASIAVLLALSATAGGFWEGMGSFLAFGVGITLPLLVLGGISQARSRQIMQYIQSHERPVQVVDRPDHACSISLVSWIILPAGMVRGV